MIRFAVLTLLLMASNLRAGSLSLTALSTEPTTDSAIYVDNLRYDIGLGRAVLEGTNMYGEQLLVLPRSVFLDGQSLVYEHSDMRHYRIGSVSSTGSNNRLNVQKSSGLTYIRTTASGRLLLNIDTDQIPWRWAFDSWGKAASFALVHGE